MAARRRRHADHDEHAENHERWLITYADMITLLMVLFIVLFSIGQTDLKKFQALKAGLEKSFGGRPGEGALDGGDGVLDGGPAAPVPVEDLALRALEDQEHREAVARQEQIALERAREEIAGELNAHGLRDSVKFRLEARGLVVTVITDQVLFDLGSATLRPEGREVLDDLAPALARLPNALAVEGHTDDRPIHAGRYPSNWELAAERATSVLRYLLEAHHLPAARLSAAGYADQRPLVPNDTEANRSQNRRVEIVVLSAEPKEQN